MESWTPRTGGNAPTVADAGEAGVLAAIRQHFAPARAEVGPGDDAAVLPPYSGRTVVTTDSMVLGPDWRDDWSPPFDVGVKAIAQNIADVVAMGAEPTGVVVALAAERATRVDWLVDLTRGMADELGRAGCGALGGDLSGAPDGTVVIAVTALGELHGPPLLRSNAEPGDVVVVSDVLGRSHAGLLVLSGAVPGGGAAARQCVRWHRAPRPRYAGAEARAAGITCAMDVSDGLGRDAVRIAHASGVRLDLDSESLKRMAQPLVQVVGERALDCVLGGGEEHALLGCVRPEAIPLGWHRIGTVMNGAGVTLGGRTVGEHGWSHFD